MSDGNLFCVKKRYVSVRTKSVEFGALLWHGRKSELDATTITSPQRSKERVRDWQRNEEKERKTAQSYILYHSLPKSSLAVFTASMSSRQAAAKTHETTPRLQLGLFMLTSSQMQETHAQPTYAVYMDASTHAHIGYISFIRMLYTAIQLKVQSQAGGP